MAMTNVYSKSNTTTYDKARSMTAYSKANAPNAAPFGLGHVSI